MDTDYEDTSIFHGKADFNEAESPILPASERVVGEAKFPLLVLRYLDSARRTGRYTDMVMRTAVGEFHVHRVVMAAVSRTIASESLTDPNYSLFTHNGPTMKTSHPALAAIIEFAYSGKTRLEVENVEGILSLAIHFQISFLINACQEFIVEHMSESTIIKFLEFSAGYPLNIIKDRVFRYLHDNLKYQLADKESRLLTVAAPAISEFITHTDPGVHKHDDEAKLELAIRYIHASSHIDKDDEVELVEAVKSLISNMSDKGLGRCLTKNPQLLFKDNVRQFLLQTGICLKNMATPDRLSKSPARNKQQFADRTFNKRQEDCYTPNSSVTSDFVVTSCTNESICSDLRSHQKRGVSAKTSCQRYNKTLHNKSPMMTQFSHTNLCNETNSDTDQAETCRIVRMVDSKTPVVVTNEKRSRDASKSSSCRGNTGAHNLADTQTNSSRVVSHDVCDFTPRPAMTRRRVMRVRESQSASPSSTDGDQSWSDSPRFANKEFELYPDLQPFPDSRTRLGEIAVFYHTLPDERPAVGGLRMTYYHRRPHVNYFRVKDIGVVPANPRRYDVVKLNDKQWIRGVGLGVSDVVHWISFYTSDKRMFGPFGHEGGQSVRVEAPQSKPELYSIHCSTRPHGKTDVLANILFRWLRPP